MRRIRSKNTKPELTIRRLLRLLGHTGYRLHWKALPGTPDIVFVSRKRAIQVHGCFWHGHDCSKGVRKPKSNEAFWLAKIQRTQQRDSIVADELAVQGWALLTIWECEMADTSALTERLSRFLTAA